MTQRTLMLPVLLWLATGCTADTGFVAKTTDNQAVDGAGQISVEPLEIFFTDLRYDPPLDASTDIVIGNTGDATLQVFSIAITENPVTDNSPQGVLYIEEVGQLELPAGAERAITIGAGLKDFEALEGTVRISSADGQQSDIYIPVHIRPEGWVDDTATE